PIKWRCITSSKIIEDVGHHNISFQHRHLKLVLKIKIDPFDDTQYQPNIKSARASLEKILFKGWWHTFLRRFWGEKKREK
ncbi:hypothetical protein PanWU01x14_157710, partial [Parasponia andersonii]